MAEYADAVVLFPGGRGTAFMRKEAEKAGITVYDFSAEVKAVGQSFAGHPRPYTRPVVLSGGWCLNPSRTRERATPVSLNGNFSCLLD